MPRLRVVLVGVLLLVLVACGGTGKEQSFENAARGKDGSGFLDGFSGEQLVDQGKGVCLRLTTPKPGRSTDESVDEVVADPPADYRPHERAWQALVDAAVQELCDFK